MKVSREPYFCEFYQCDSLCLTPPQEQDRVQLVATTGADGKVRYVKRPVDGTDGPYNGTGGPYGGTGSPYGGTGSPYGGTGSPFGGTGGRGGPGGRGGRGEPGDAWDAEGRPIQEDHLKTHGQVGYCWLHQAY